MTDTISKTNKSNSIPVDQRKKPSLRIGRSLVSGILTLVALSVAGGVLVGLIAGRAVDDRAALVRCAKAVRIFDLLLATPLAIGIAAALVAGVPAFRALRARKSREPRPAGWSNALVVAGALVGGWVTAAVFWSVSGFLVPRISLTAANWVNGDNVDQLHTAFYGFKLPSIENWSIIESISLALVLVVAASFFGGRRLAGAGRTASRPVLVTAAVVVLVLGATFTWHAAQAYHDMRATAMSAAGRL